MEGPLAASRLLIRSDWKAFYHDHGKLEINEKQCADRHFTIEWHPKGMGYVHERPRILEKAIEPEPLP